MEEKQQCFVQFITTGTESTVRTIRPPAIETAQFEHRIIAADHSKISQNGWQIFNYGFAVNRIPEWILLLCSIFSPFLNSRKNLSMSAWLWEAMKEQALKHVTERQAGCSSIVRPPRTKHKWPTMNHLTHSNSLLQNINSGVLLFMCSLECIELMCEHADVRVNKCGAVRLEMFLPSIHSGLTAGQLTRCPMSIRAFSLRPTGKPEKKLRNSIRSAISADSELFQ